MTRYTGYIPATVLRRTRIVVKLRNFHDSAIRIILSARARNTYKYTSPLTKYARLKFNQFNVLTGFDSTYVGTYIRAIVKKYDMPLSTLGSVLLFNNNFNVINTEGRKLFPSRDEDYNTTTVC